MLASALSRIFGQDTKPLDPQRFLRFVPYGKDVAAGMNINVEEALQLSVVWACVDAITKAVSCSPWSVYQLDTKQKGRRNWTLLPEDPLDWILNGRPNPEMTAIAFREALLFSALTWGNGYAEIVRSLTGQVTQLWPLLPDRVHVKRDEEDVLYYEYTNPDGSKVALDQRQVFHLRGPSLDGLMGDHLVVRMAKVIGVAMAQERFGANYFANGTIVGAYLEYPQKLDTKTRDLLKEDWEEKHKGVGKSHKPMILEGGMKLHLATHEAEKAQLVESRKFSIEEICRFYGVPPHKVQHLDRATFNNIEHLGIEFVRDAVKPWALRHEQEADYKLFPLGERKPFRHTKFDTSWLKHGDAKTTAETHNIYRRIGVYSANDILERLGENTIAGPEGEARLVESNMTTMEGIDANVEGVKAKTEATKNPPQPPAAPGGGDGSSNWGKDKKPPEGEDAPDQADAADKETK